MLLADGNTQARRRDGFCPLAVWHLIAVGAAQAALVLLLIDWRLAWTPLLIFAAAMAVGPFFPRWGLFLPVAAHGRRDGRAVALTFDDGPHPATTPALLALLKRRGATAAFFVVGRQAAAHPELIRAILADGHEIGNHTFSHDVFIALRSRRRLHAEIRNGQAALAPFGVEPLAFRPPVGIVNPFLRSILLQVGLDCVGFSLRGPDVGNRRLDGLAQRLLRRVAPGDVVLLHDAPPPNRPAADWQREVEALLDGLAQRGLAVEPLSRLLRRPIMRPVGGGARPPAAAYYDAAAATYDAEQQRPAMAKLRREEERVVQARLTTLVKPGDRALELGAGTGRFTLRLAEFARQTTAVDVSAEMAAALAAKARAAGAANVQGRVADFRTMTFDERYNLICAFSCFEYVDDLSELFVRLARALAPGGRLYFTTAHRSFFRFFVQIGNALRQGVWLRARRRGEIETALRAAGLAPADNVRVFGGPDGRMLVEVVAGRSASAAGEK